MSVPVWKILGKDNKTSYKRQSCTITMLASEFCIQTNTLLTNFTSYTKGNIFTKRYHKSIALILMGFFLWVWILCIMLGTNEKRCEKNHLKIATARAIQKVLFFHKTRITESWIQIRPAVLSCLQEKVQEMTAYFRAHFGEKWCETALILVRIGLVLSKVKGVTVSTFLWWYQWKYILYTNQKNIAENRDNGINPYIF